MVSQKVADLPMPDEKAEKLRKCARVPTDLDIGAMGSDSELRSGETTKAAEQPAIAKANSLPGNASAPSKAAEKAMKHSAKVPDDLNNDPAKDASKPALLAPSKGTLPAVSAKSEEKPKPRKHLPTVPDDLDFGLTSGGEPAERPPPLCNQTPPRTELQSLMLAEHARQRQGDLESRDYEEIGRLAIDTVRSTGQVRSRAQQPITWFNMLVICFPRKYAYGMNRTVSSFTSS